MLEPTPSPLSGPVPTAAAPHGREREAGADGFALLLALLGAGSVEPLSLVAGAAIPGGSAPSATASASDGTAPSSALSLVSAGLSPDGRNGSAAGSSPVGAATEPSVPGAGSPDAALDPVGLGAGIRLVGGAPSAAAGGSAAPADGLDQAPSEADPARRFPAGAFGPFPTFQPSDEPGRTGGVVPAFVTSPIPASGASPASGSSPALPAERSSLSPARGSTAEGKDALPTALAPDRSTSTAAPSAADPANRTVVVSAPSPVVTNGRFVPDGQGTPPSRPGAGHSAVLRERTDPAAAPAAAIQAGSTGSGGATRPAVAPGSDAAIGRARVGAADAEGDRPQLSSDDGPEASPAFDPAAIDGSAVADAAPAGESAPSRPAGEPAALPRGPLAPPPQPPAVQVAASILQRDGVPLERLRIALQPAELGSVEVTLVSEGRRKARALVLVDRPETLELLQRDQRSLERILVASGLELAAGGLELGLRRDGEGQRGGIAPPAGGPSGDPLRPAAEPVTPPRLLDVRLLDLVV